MTTKLNLVNDQIVALSVTTTESLVANTISGDGTRVSNVDAVLLDGQNSAYYRNYNNLTNTPDLNVYSTKADSVASNNAIKGLIDTKLAVSNATATFAPINNATMTGTTQFANLSDGTITITAFVDEDNMASDSASLVPTQQSVKAYVDTEIAGISSSFTLSADSGSDDTFTTGGTLTFAGTANEIETTVTNDQIQIGLPNNVTIGNNLTVSGALNSDDITAAQVSVNGNAVITGNLTVQGTTTTVNSTEVTIADSVFRVNSDGSVVSAGLEAIIGANTESILFNPSTQRWEFSGDMHTAGNMSVADVTFANLNDGTITVAGFVDEDNMASDSATLIPTQQSVKAYVDSEVAGSGGNLQPQIDDRMQVANVNSIQTTLQSNIDTKMAVANVNTIQTNLQNSIDTKLAVANATLQTITSTGATTTDSITVGGLTAASIAYPGTDGTSGQAIVTDGSGNLSFETVARDPIPTLGSFNAVKLGSITPDGSTSYSLAYANGASYSVTNENSLLVSLNGIIQEPGSSFTTSGSTITFSSAVTATDELNFIVDMAPTGTFTITNNTITAQNIAANNITVNGTSVSTMISNSFNDIVDNAPSTLDTLNELAAAMGDDQFFANTVTNSIATKLATADFNTTLDARLSSGSMTSNFVTTGNMTAANFNTTSDQRLKSNIADAAPSSAIVDAIQVRQFDWNDSGKHDDYGFVAQELHAVYPAAVTPGESEAEYWTVDFSKLVPLLVKEIQDLKARIVELEG